MWKVIFCQIFSDPVFLSLRALVTPNWFWGVKISFEFNHLFMVCGKQLTKTSFYEFGQRATKPKASQISLCSYTYDEKLDDARTKNFSNEIYVTDLSKKNLFSSGKNCLLVFISEVERKISNQTRNYCRQKSSVTLCVCCMQ